MNRFSCRMQEIPTKPALELSRKKGQTGKHGKEPPLLFKKGQIVFQTRNLEVWINTRTGWIDRYQVGGVDCLKKNAFAHLIMKDDPDSWGTLVKRFRTQDSRFRLMSQSRSARFAGSSQRRLPSVRVIEDGPVRSVIEAVFAIHDSCICQQYLLPKQGTELEVRVRVFWNEKQRMLKLSIPTRLESAEYWGQVAFGRERLDNGGNETVAQQWTAAVSEERNHAITCINKTSYGSDMKDGEIRFSLLRSPAYASLPVANQPLIAQDRFIPHMDQGERLFRFWLNAGPKTERLDSIETEARVKHEKPFALPYFPSGEGHPLKPVMQITDSAVQVTALKKAEKSNHLIIRLFEPTGRPRSFTLTLPFIGLRTKVSLGAFEIKTLRIDTKKGKSMEVDLMENRIGGRRQ
ncbi:MAG: glycoside hydrolase family 38 C-terminal domain-containing protein [Planctomycetota bacterium]